MSPDIIATIYKPTGVILTDEDGNEYPEMETTPGYHVNYPVDHPELVDYKCDPQPVTPHRVYAGADPVCYVFPDEATFRSLVPEDKETQV